MMKRLATALLTSFAFASLAFGHAGVTNFMPTVPDPRAMNIDGSEDDWGWYDPTFAILPDQVVQHVDGTANADDWTGTWQWAWSPPPDNALFFFMRAFDDTLRAEDINKLSWWNNDNLHQGFDMDHGGGDTTVNDEPLQFNNGYRTHTNPLFAPIVGISMGGLGGDPAALPHWGGNPPWTWVSGVMLPADADHFSANVEFTIEYKMHTHDIYDPDSPENTVAHVNEVDQVVHIGQSFDDGDLGDHGGQNGWVQIGTENFFGGVIHGDGMADWQLLLTIDSIEGYPCGTVNGGAGDPRFQDQCPEGSITSVEHATWARIKSHTQR
jgi:hypothetical protein